MKYGAHSASIEAMLLFLKNSGILNGAFADANDVHLVCSLDDVVKFRDPDEHDAVIKGNMNWIDIKRVDEDHLVSKLSNELWSVYESLEVEVREILVRTLVRRIPEYEIEEIEGDFCAIGFQRMANGIVAGSFYESLFDIYAKNGFPCGWSGDFPDGKLVVYAE